MDFQFKKVNGCKSLSIIDKFFALYFNVFITLTKIYLFALIYLHFCAKSFRYPYRTIYEIFMKDCKQHSLSRDVACYQQYYILSNLNFSINNHLDSELMNSLENQYGIFHDIIQSISQFLFICGNILSNFQVNKISQLSTYNLNIFPSVVISLFITSAYNSSSTSKACFNILLVSASGSSTSS